MNETRRCNKCGKLKSLKTEFYKIKRCKDGRDPRCIECRREVRRKIPSKRKPRKQSQLSKKQKNSNGQAYRFWHENLSEDQIKLAVKGKCIDCKSKIDHDGFMAGAVRCMSCIRSERKYKKKPQGNIYNDFAQIIFVDPDYFRDEEYHAQANGFQSDFGNN